MSQHPPSQRRLHELRSRGIIPFSEPLTRGISTLVVLLVASATLPRFAVDLGLELWRWEDGAPSAFTEARVPLDVLRAVLVVTFCGLVASFLAAALQARGARQGASEPSAGVRLSRGVTGTLIALVSVGALFAWASAHFADATQLSQSAFDAGLIALGVSAAGTALLGGIDYGLTRSSFMKTHRMSSAELKRELEEGALPESVRKARGQEQRTLGAESQAARYRRWFIGAGVSVLVVWSDVLGAAPRVASVRRGGAARGLSRRAGDRPDAEAPELARELAALGIGVAVPRRYWERLV